MIDIHSHILPGMDDGAADLTIALSMAEIAVKEGISEIIATPHCCDGVFNCQRKDILQNCDRFNEELVNAGINLTVYPGAEVRLTPETIALYDSGELLTLGDSENALLIELPERFIQQSVIKILQNLVDRHLEVIIAHPERNLTIQKCPEFVTELNSLGCCLQVTSLSLNGNFGRATKKISEEIINSSNNVCLASDCHNLSRRAPKMKKAVKKLQKMKGQDFVAAKMMHHKTILLKNTDVTIQSCG